MGITSIFIWFLHGILTPVWGKCGEGCEGSYICENLMRHDNFFYNQEVEDWIFEEGQGERGDKAKGQVGRDWLARSMKVFADGCFAGFWVPSLTKLSKNLTDGRMCKSEFRKNIYLCTI